MDAAIEHVKPAIISSPSEWEESYRPLPFLFFGLLITWMVLVFLWTLNTWSKRRWQVSSVQYSRLLLLEIDELHSLLPSLEFFFLLKTSGSKFETLPERLNS